MLSSKVTMFALASLMLVTFAIPTTATPTNCTKYAGRDSSTQVFEVQMVTSSSVVIFDNPSTSSPEASSPSPQDQDLKGLSKKPFSIEEWVEERKPMSDFWALSVSVSLLPQLRDELTPAALRYRNLGLWTTKELNKTESESWDIVMRFLDKYPAFMCRAFKADSTFRLHPSCVQTLYVEPMEKLRLLSTAACRDHIFTPSCNVTVALLGTGISEQQVSLWQSRMNRFSVYMIGIRPDQRLERREEAMCYQFVFCLKTNSKNLEPGVDAKLKQCIEAVNAEQGIIHRK